MVMHEDDSISLPLPSTRWIWKFLTAGGGVALLVFLLLAAMVGFSSTHPGRNLAGQASSLPEGGLLPSLKRWRADINAASRHSGVPATWIAAEIWVESQGNPHAGSLAGAYGLMQLEPGTDGAANSQRMDPSQNILIGAQYLSTLYAQFHSWRLASAAYYGGAGLVQSLLPTFPESWRAAAQWLQVVPDPAAGNTLTLRDYASEVETIAQQLASDCASAKGGAACHAS